MSLISDDTVRLVVLTGTTGVGKTRLALHIANLAQSAFPDGIWFVPLATVPYPEMVTPTIARALGLWERSRESLEERLHAALAGKRALLILDNFEQVASAASELIDILEACPRLTILVTSRTVLHVTGEHNVHLTPLSLANATEPTGADTADLPDAVRLFVERARAVQRDFTLTRDNAGAVHELCRRLEGLPLAIELAAARVGNHTPRSLIDRLDHPLQFLSSSSQEEPDGRLTMRNAIEWSFKLLSPDEQRMFRRLSVFSDGMSVEAILAVAMPGSGKDPADEWIAIDTAASLVDQSLMFQAEGALAEPRFFMMEVIREYGLEHLASSDEEDEVRERHARWCLSLARRINATFTHHRDTAWRDQLEQEHANFRAALGWLQVRGDAEGMLSLTNELYPLWWHLGHGQEGIRWLNAGLEHPEGVDPKVVIRAMLALSKLVADQTDHDLALDLAIRAAGRSLETGNDAALADARFQIARNHQLSGDVDKAREQYRAAQDLYLRIGDEIGTAVTRTYISMLDEFEEGFDAQSASACWEAELRLYEQRNDIVRAGRARHGLSYVSYLAGDYPRALSLAHQVLQLLWSMGDIRLIPAVFEDVGDIAGATGQAEAAVRLYAAADVLRKQLDTPIPPWFQADYDQEIARRRRQLPPARFAAAWEAGRALSLPEAVAETLAIRVQGATDTRSPQANPFELTGRELEVLNLLVDGKTNQEIAAILDISKKTVANHVGNILAKLGVESRTAAVSLAIRDALL